MSKGKFPRVVTLVDKGYPGHAGVYMLLREGPKNYQIQGIPDEPGGWQPQPRLEEKDKRILLEGEHRGLVKRLREAEQEYNAASEAWGKARSEALYNFRMQWDTDHPTPCYPTVEKITAAYLQELAELKAAMAAQS